MRSLLARLAVLSAFAVSLSACSNGNGSTLPFAGPPNNAGGTSGTVQTGSNGQALIRFVQGSPDYAKVDVCIDQASFGITTPVVAYGAASSIFAIAGGINHTIAVYPTAGASAGAECATAPGPYFGTAPIKTTTLNVGSNVRWSVVLGGTGAGKTLGFYIFNEPTYVIPPPGAVTLSYNAAPTYSALAANANKSVGFGYTATAGGPVTTLTGAGSVAPAKVTTGVATSVIGAPVASGLAVVPPATFVDGAGVTTGAIVQVGFAPAPSASTTGQPYVVQLYAIDAAAGGLALVAVLDQVLGYGF